jgi:hypothetical protein
MAMQWLENTLVFASDTAIAGLKVKANGERCGSASCHLALALYESMQPQGQEAYEGSLPVGSDRATNNPVALDELRDLVLAVGGEDFEFARAEMVTLLDTVPALLGADRFNAPSGMHDLPQILATAWYGRDISVDSFNGYLRFVRRMHWLLFMVKGQWAQTPQGKDVDKQALLTAINETEGDNTLFARSAETEIKLGLTGRMLMPTLAAVVAAVDVNSSSIVGKDDPFVKFVHKVHESFIADNHEFSNVTITSPLEVQFLLHMNKFLSEAAEQLETAVLQCDRAPIIMPWYTLIVLAARRYAHVLAIALGVPKVEENTGVAFTLFTLFTLANPDVEAMLNPGVEERSRPLSLRPMRSLFSARSKSMYMKSSTQSGPWWVLLRAALSGLSIDAADTLAKRLVEAAKIMPGVARNVGMLCVLMHTQAGMRVVGMRTSHDAHDLSDFPIAKLISRDKDPSNGQTPIDLLMTTFSGTSDLRLLASDDLAFNAEGHQVTEYAWKREIALRVEDGLEIGPPPTRPPKCKEDVGLTVRNFCNAMRAIGMDWMLSFSDAKAAAQGGPNNDGPVTAAGAAATPSEIVITREEMLSALCRVASSHAMMHCPEWLTISFALACKLEDFYQSPYPAGLGEPALIRGSRCLVTCPGTEHDMRKDDTFLRSHFCLLAEMALHSARANGLWAMGYHLVLAAWLSTTSLTTPEDSNVDEEYDDVRIFARVITAHTIPNRYDSDADPQLLTDEWRRSVEESGSDSVVQCAIEFQLALRECNLKAQQLHTETGDAQQRVPAIHEDSDRQICAQNKASGPGRFDQARVPALDKTTDAAMALFRVSVKQIDLQSKTFICSSPYAHGAAVAVLAIPPSNQEVYRNMKRNGTNDEKRTDEKPTDERAARAARLMLLRRISDAS